ncbi:MAG: flavin reductase family protein, partial [Candidatus Eremiobacteraeota bacterium]|nr:flavin reductase family protein [Candidatus Eremiobacteraeota bacterium]
MRRFATGVAIVTTAHEGRIHGFTANAFASVSVEPPTVLVCVNRVATAHRLISASQLFCVNILALEQRAL